MRLAARLFAVAGMLLLVGPAPGQAAVDLTGTYDVFVQFVPVPSPGLTGTFTFTQVGTDLTLTYSLSAPGQGPFNGTFTGGTIDPDAGTFAFSFPDTPSPSPGELPPCTGNGITGTATPDGATITGQWVEQFYVTFGTHQQCANPFGAFSGGDLRCGDGLVTAGETCDDGNTVDGDCCSSTCQLEPAGSPCDDGNGCTAGDACDVYGICRSGKLACAPCETCVSGACVTGPEPSCTATTGSAALTLDLAHDRLSATARTTAPFIWTVPQQAEHALCVFASDGSVWTPLAATHVPAAPMCSGGSCWTSRRGRMTYRNPAGTPDGTELLTLATTARPMYRLRAGSPNLQPAGSVPLTIPDVRIQLRSTDLTVESCFATDFANVMASSPTRLRLRRR